MKSKPRKGKRSGRKTQAKGGKTRPKARKTATKGGKTRPKTRTAQAKARKTDAKARKTGAKARKTDAKARKTGAKARGAPAKRLYTLDVFIIGGPVTDEFLRKNKVISRSIQIRGDQTLEDLHQAIFEAFDREDEHMYEFQIGGRGPMDPNARRYVLSLAMEGGFPDEASAGDVSSTTLESLGLQLHESFGYWFDFGDDWWHQVNVASIKDRIPPGRYPKVTKRVGQSPPQYPGWEGEE